MIINQYTGELKENMETGLTFHVHKCPQLFVRMFEPRFNYGRVLAVPYHIIDALDRKSVDDESDWSYREDHQVTYTTIVTLDEHLSPTPRTWKRTSYCGEQVIELGPFTRDDVGVHVIAMRCVNSFGVGSATQYFKFMVEDPRAEVETIDLENISAFNGSFGYDASTLVDDEGGTPTNGSTKFEPSSEHNAYVVKKTIVADYHVNVVRQDGVVQKIVITVDGGTDTGSPSDKGFIYRYDVNAWTGLSSSTRDVMKEKISGQYALVLRHNGVALSDYLSAAPTDVPANIRKLAANNKIALTRLMEAAQAKAGGKRCTLILPKDMSIVTDLHQVDADGNVMTMVWDSIEKKYVGGTNIIFPDRFTLDMNGSAVSVLQVDDVQNGIVVALGNNFDTIVRNGFFRGNYKHYSTTYKADGVGSTEWNRNSSIWGCEFCMFENCDFAYSLGYDAGIENYKSYDYRSARVGYSTYCLPYDTPGYIDYQGVEHDGPVTENELLAMRYTKGIRQGTDPKYDSRLSARRTFRSNGGYLWGDIISLEKADGPSQGTYSRLVNRECFIHFYDADRQFVKTAKVRDTGPILVPREAMYVGHSCFGANVEGTINSTYFLDGTQWNRIVGQPFVYAKKRSWCSGYKNCFFHDNRTSLFDNKETCQCFATGCYMWNLGCERDANKGGFNNQSYFVDIEESVNNDNFFVTGCENVYGNKGFNVHHSYNICLLGNRDFNPMLNKNVYGAQLECHYGLHRASLGFSAPLRYHTISNNLFTKLRVGWEFVSQSVDDDGRVHVSDSTVITAETFSGSDSGGRYPKLFTRNCKIINNNIEKS